MPRPRRCSVAQHPVGAHGAAGDGQRQVGPALARVAPQRPQRRSGRPARAVPLRRLGERDLPEHACQAPRLAAELGVALEQPDQRRGDRLPARREVRPLVPPHVDVRAAVTCTTGCVAGGAQQELVVLGVAAGDLLVDEARPVQQARPRRIRNVDGCSSVSRDAQQVGQRRPACAVQRAVHGVVGVPHRMPHVDEHGVRYLGQRRHLGPQLARDATVVVVAERHQRRRPRPRRRCCGRRPGRACGGCARPARGAPRRRGHQARGRARSGRTPRRRAPAGVVLLADAREGPAQQLRPVAGGHDDVHARPHLGPASVGSASSVTSGAPRRVGQVLRGRVAEAAAQRVGQRRRRRGGRAAGAAHASASSRRSGTAPVVKRIGFPATVCVRVSADGPVGHEARGAARVGQADVRGMTRSSPAAGPRRRPRSGRSPRVRRARRARGTSRCRRSSRRPPAAGRSAASSTRTPAPPGRSTSLAQE